MIKIVFLDVVGVLLGNAPGVNYPEPNSAVLERIHSIKQRGVVVSLCTTDPYFVIEEIVQQSELFNWHIVNAGRTLIDPNTGLAKQLPPGSMKDDGVKAVLREYNIPTEDALGVGDSVSDWGFIQLCGCGGAMGNSSEELKQLVLGKGPGRGVIGKTVNEHGLLTILDFYNL